MHARDERPERAGLPCETDVAHRLPGGIEHHGTRVEWASGREERGDLQGHDPIGVGDERERVRLAGTVDGAASRGIHADGLRAVGLPRCVGALAHRPVARAVREAAGGCGHRLQGEEEGPLLVSSRVTRVDRVGARGRQRLRLALVNRVGAELGAVGEEDAVAGRALQKELGIEVRLLAGGGGDRDAHHLVLGGVEDELLDVVPLLRHELERLAAPDDERGARRRRGEHARQHDSNREQMPDCGRHTGAGGLQATCSRKSAKGPNRRRHRWGREAHRRSILACA